MDMVAAAVNNKSTRRTPADLRQAKSGPERIRTPDLHWIRMTSKIWWDFPVQTPMIHLW